MQPIQGGLPLKNVELKKNKRESKDPNTRPNKVISHFVDTEPMQ